MKRKLKALIFILAAVFGVLTFTGCGSSLNVYFTSDFPRALDERQKQNENIAKQLLDSGFIDKTMYSKICDEIESEVSRLKKDCIKVGSSDDASTALSATSVQTLSAAVSAVCPRHPEYVEYDDSTDGSGSDTSGAKRVSSSKVGTSKYRNGNRLSSTDAAPSSIESASLSHFVASNYIVGIYLGKTVCNEGTNNKFTVGKWTDKEATPINLFSNQDDLLESLNKKFRASMYVLDSEAIQASGKSMDEVFGAIKKAVDKDDISGVTHYFKKLTDENGKAVSLMPDDFKIIRESRKNTEKMYSKPGYDLIMKQKLLYHNDSKCDAGYGMCTDTDHAFYNELPVLAVRFTEFDSDAFKTLQETININSGAYYFENLNSTESSGGQTTKCYVLTYPISVIDSFNLDNSNGNVTATFNDKSGMAVSIQTGRLISYDYNSDNKTFSTVSHEVTTSDPYLTMNFDSSVGDDKSSLVCDGYRTYDINYTQVKDDGSQEPGTKKVVVPRIILRDYLEATWAPGSTSYDETMVVFGRKIRFRTDTAFWTTSTPLSFGNNTFNCDTLQYNINNKDWCASFVNIDGDEVGSLTKLHSTDFCDIDALTGDGNTSNPSNKWEKYTVKHFREANISAASTSCSAEANETAPTQDKIASTTDVTSIKATAPFPGAYIGAKDLKNTGAEVQRFYCVATTKGMFESALYSDWVNSTASKESLTWWNTYLSDHGYKYKIGADELSTYMKTNYAYELSQQGPIILDLNTVDKIQKIYDKEDSENRAALTKTLFVVFGIFLIAYSMILMLCWVIDTNVDIGVSLLNKATFGHWIAIQYDDELPSYNNEEHNYIDGKHMLIKCLIIVAVAIVLIRVDASDVVLSLINTFGKIASYAEQTIKGIL